MSASPPSSRDVADILEAIARRIRQDPSFAAEMLRRPSSAARVTVSQPSELAVQTDETPDFGEIDVFVGETHITVTVETHNADQTNVHVSVMDRQLILCVGEGEDEKRRDVMLPHDVDEDLAAATFRNGVLDVVLPMRAPLHGAARSKARQ